MFSKVVVIPQYNIYLTSSDEKQGNSSSSSSSSSGDRDADAEDIEDYLPTIEGLPQRFPYRKKYFYVRECYREYCHLIMKLIKNPRISLVTITGSPGIGKSIFYMYCFHVFRHLKFTILTAAFSKKGDIENEILLWRSGVQDPERLIYNGDSFLQSIKDTKVIKLFDGPSPLQFIKFGPSIVFTSPNKDYFDSMKKFMHSTNQYLKLWSEEEITEAVSVLRAKCAIDEEITDAVIKEKNAEVWSDATTTVLS